MPSPLVEGFIFFPKTLKNQMKNLNLFLFFLFIGFLCFGFRTPLQVSKVNFTKLIGYQKKMAMSPPQSHAQLYFRKEQFDNYFEKSPGINQNQIQFGKDVVITMVFPKSKQETIVKLERINKVDGIWEIYFTSKRGKTLKKEAISQGLYLAKIDSSIHGIVIYLDGKVHTDLRN
jgi:hypothetical protein